MENSCYLSIFVSKKKGYADLEIETFFAKYDKDCDRKLNLVEKLKLARDIVKVKSHLSEEFQKSNEDDDAEKTGDTFQ